VPRTATIMARTDVAALRVERDNLMSLVAELPSIAIEIISELGQRLHSTNQSLAFLTYAANALARGEYDAAMLAELTRQSGALATFARAFSDMAAEIQAKQTRREEMEVTKFKSKDYLDRWVNPPAALEAEAKKMREAKAKQPASA